MKRCFGKEERIIDCDWNYLSQQRTLKAPHEPMPRLKDLLGYLASPGLEATWVLLDIKVINSISMTGGAFLTIPPARQRC